MRIFLLFLLTFPGLLFAQNTLIPGTEILVHNQSSYGYARPMVGVNASGNAVVMWGKRNNQNVYVAVQNGTSFGMPKKLNPNGMTVFAQDWAGPEMAIAGNKVFVTFKSQPENSGFVYVVSSNDGGLTFSDTVRVSNRNWSRFPAIAASSDGSIVYVAYMAFEPNFAEPHYVLCTSTDGGKTFGPEVIASTAPGEVCDCCPANVTATAEGAIISFRNNDDNLRDVWIAISSDKGKSFTAVGDVDDTDWNIFGCPSSGPTSLKSSDSVYTTWMAALSGKGRIYMASSNATGQATPSFKLTQNAEKEVSQNYPKIAGKRNALGVIWEETNTGVGSIQAMFSSNGTTGMVGASKIRVDATESGIPQNPTIFYDGTNFHCVWQNNQRHSIYYNTLSVGQSSIAANNLPKLNLFPNPANSFVTLDANPADVIELCNMQGRVIVSQKVQQTGRQQIPTIILQPGTYLVKVFSEAEMTIGTLIIVH